MSEPNPATFEDEVQSFEEQSIEEELEARKSQHAAADDDGTSFRFPVGAVAGGITGGSVGGLPGAVVGTVLGEVAQNAAEIAFDLPTQPKTGLDASRRIGGETLFALAGEGAGRGVLKAGEKILGRFNRAVTPEAESAIAFLSPRTDVQLLPAEATDEFSLDLAQNIAAGSFLGGRRIFDFTKNRQNILDQMGREMTQKVWGGVRADTDMAGKALVASANKNFNQFTEPAHILYNSLRDAIAPKAVKQTVIEKVPGPGGLMVRQPVERQVLKGGLRTDTFSTVKNWVKKHADVQERLNQIGNEQVGGSLLTRINKFPSNPYVSDLIELRSRLRAERVGLESNPVTRKSPAIKNVSTIEGMVDTIIRENLRRADPRLLATFDEANKIWKEGSRIYRSRVIKELSRISDIEKGGAGAESVAKAIFRPNRFSRMQAVKRAVSPAAWKRIARQGMEEIVEIASKGGITETGVSVPDGFLDGNKLMRLLVNPKSGLGPKGLTTAVGEVEAQNWLKLANATMVSQAKTPIPTGTMFIQLKQAGAIGAAIEAGGGGLLGFAGLGDDKPNRELGISGAAILLTPLMLSRLMTNPTAVNIMIRGMKMSPKAFNKAGLVGRLATIAATMNPLIRPPEKSVQQPTPLAPFRMPSVSSQKVAGLQLGKQPPFQGVGQPRAIR